MSSTPVEDPKGVEEEALRPFYVGKGSWHWISAEQAEQAQALASGKWADALTGIDLPWLCWNVQSDWCLVQQRMVASAGWTPIVGFDPRIGPPPLIEGARLVDFNEGLDLPAMSMMFPIEFAWLFAPRLAFWHSDLLVREPLFRRLSDRFKALRDGQTAAVDMRLGWLRRLRGHYGRYWELIGCTTRHASLDQFNAGCGWWRHPMAHPNAPTGPQATSRKKYMKDHGVGILMWDEQAGGDVVAINARPLHEGHCTRIGNPHYRKTSPTDARRDLSKDLPSNYDLREVCAQLGLSHFLGPPGSSD
ncbi:hypothetical protein [Thioalkalivibrio sp. ALM2T]|uniref:hypothetical protein n=1 Tax=Thioalkalivibrio sp. ALM2T TaxID=1158184 RepID=UPI000367F7CC|nr:hypothetical protein [Thioalkalivibrio sp. ALM2T]